MLIFEKPENRVFSFLFYERKPTLILKILVFIYLFVCFVAILPVWNVERVGLAAYVF